jgi:hypothetical protein
MTATQLRSLRSAFVAVATAATVTNVVAFLVPVLVRDPAIVRFAMPWVFRANAAITELAFVFALWACVRARAIVLAVVTGLMLVVNVAHVVVGALHFDRTLVSRVVDLVWGSWWFVLAMKLFAIRESRAPVVAALIVTLLLTAVSAVLARGDTTAVLVSYAVGALGLIVTWGLLLWAFRRAARTYAQCIGDARNRKQQLTISRAQPTGRRIFHGHERRMRHRVVVPRSHALRA